MRRAMPFALLTCIVSMASAAGDLRPGIGAVAACVTRHSVVPRGSLTRGIVLIEKARIPRWVATLPCLQGRAWSRQGGTIYPGLIDLRDHVTWNALAGWSAKGRSGACYDWGW